MGEDILDISNWKDKMLGDLKQFSSKKYRPVGLHHLISDIERFTKMNHLIDFSYLPFSTDFILPGGKLSLMGSTLRSKLSSKFNFLKTTERQIPEGINAVILYAIPLPRSIFNMDLKKIKEEYQKIASRKKDIDYLITRALEKYGYTAITHPSEIARITGKLDTSLIFKEAHMGELLPNNFPVSIEYGPRMLLFPILTDAPLKLERDLPSEIPPEKLKKIDYTKHIKDYRKKFGIVKTVIDTLYSIILTPKLGKLISICYSSSIDKTQEINLMVKDPLDYKE